jgi:hypothetical protein
MKSPNKTTLLGIIGILLLLVFAVAGTFEDLFSINRKPAISSD